MQEFQKMEVQPPSPFLLQEGVAAEVVQAVIAVPAAGSMRKHLVIATRGSALALWQANFIKENLEELDPALRVSLNVIKTKGDVIQDVPLDKVGGKGLFVKEIEQALLDGRADLAVHSIKDVPMALPEGLILGCIPKREEVSDCFLSNTFSSLDKLPFGARVGTSSLRRKAQLLSKRPDLQIVNLRGNIDTRLRKLDNGEYDAIILATAGLFRLGLHAKYMQPLEKSALLPAVGQGALGIECSEDNYQLLVLLASLEDRASRVCVDTERSFLKTLNGSCQVPIAASAVMTDEETVRIEGLVAEEDGSLVIKDEKTGNAIDSEKTGAELARTLLDKGAQSILDNLAYSHNS